MQRIRHTPEQIIRKLKTAEQLIAQGKNVTDICRAIEVTQPTYHRWREQYSGIQPEKAKRLNQLDKENARLKKLLAEAELEKVILLELAEECPSREGVLVATAAPGKALVGLPGPQDRFPVAPFGLGVVIFYGLTTLRLGSAVYRLLL